MSNAQWRPNVAVVGHGYWGKNIARVFSQSPDFNLHTICDARDEVRQRVAGLYPSTQQIADLEDLDDDVEVVAIVTPTDSHYELAKACLENGKHVLLTKPFTRYLWQTEELLALADERNLTVFADYTFVFNPAVRKLKEMLPRIGTPYFVLSQRLNLGLYQPDVNVVYDLMPHDLSILSYLFDRSLLSAQTTLISAAGLPQEDLAHTSFTLEGNLQGHITVSWLSPYKVRQFYVVGSEGMLSYDDTEVTEKIKFLDRGISVAELSDVQSQKAYTSRISYRSGDLYSPAIPNTEALAFELQEFRSALTDPATRKRYNQLNLDIMTSLQHVVDGAASTEAAFTEKV